MNRVQRLIFSLLVILACASDARANMAKWWSEGESHGVLVPQGDTKVHVDSEDLAFVVDATLKRAAVTATYHLTNGGAVASRGDIAFVMVAAEHAEASVAEATVTIDGAPVPSKIITDADVLGPALEAWLFAHPAAETELTRLAALDRRAEQSDMAVLRGYAPGCTGDCSDLLLWFEQRKTRPQSRDVFRAAAEAIPEQAKALQRGWSRTGYGGGLSWLTFPLAIEPGAKQTIVVKYTHVAGSDQSLAVNTVFTYAYLLSPAKRWASFGQLHVTIDLPANTRLLGPSLPFTEQGTTYRADLPSLPNQELTFGVMTRSGLLFGMTQPMGYWLLLLAAMALATVPIATRLGRVFIRSGARFGFVLRCLFGTGLAALVVNGIIAFVLSNLFPQRAFGHSYGAAFGMLLVVPLVALAGAILSVVAGSRARRALP